MPQTESKSNSGVCRGGGLGVMLTAVRACARVLQAAMAKSLASTMAGMSAPQGLLVATAVTGYVSWSYSSAAKLKDNMETQVYVRRRPHFPANLRVRAWTHASWPYRDTRCAWRRR
jgi:hypothetical protein